MKKIIVLLIFNILSFNLLSQTMETGIYGGAVSYLGDLNKHQVFHKIRPVYGITARYNFNPRVSTRLDVKYNNVSVKEQNPGVFNERPLSIDFSTLSANIVGEFNFYNYFIGSKKHTISPFLFGGIGYNYNFITVDESASANFNRNALVIPFGVGVKFSLTSKLGVTIDWTMNRMMNDWLDALPEHYYNNEKQQYSDGSTKDYLSQIGLTLLYKIDLRSKSKCYGVGGRY